MITKCFSYGEEVDVKIYDYNSLSKYLKKSGVTDVQFKVENNEELKSIILKDIKLDSVVIDFNGNTKNPITIDISKSMISRLSICDNYNAFNSNPSWLKLHQVYTDMSLDTVNLKLSITRSYLRGSLIKNSKIVDSSFLDTSLESNTFMLNLFNNVVFSFCNLQYSVVENSLFKSSSFYECNLKYSLHTISNMEQESYLSMFKNCLMINDGCSKHGEIVGWKRCYVNNNRHEHCLVKLLIPEDAKRSSSTTEKCRCNKAKVLEIIPEDFELEEGQVLTKANSFHNPNFEYRLGEVVEEHNFDNDWSNECAPGIHFFTKKEDAINYLK